MAKTSGKAPLRMVMEASKSMSFSVGVLPKVVMSLKIGGKLVATLSLKVGRGMGSSVFASFAEFARFASFAMFVEIAFFVLLATPIVMLTPASLA